MLSMHVSNAKTICIWSSPQRLIMHWMCIHYLLAMLSGMYFCVCVFHPVLPPSWSWNTQISVFIMKIYPTASRIYLQIQAMCWLQQMAPPGRRLSVGTWILSYLHVTSLSCKLATSFFPVREYCALLTYIRRFSPVHATFTEISYFLYERSFLINYSVGALVGYHV